MRAVLRAAGMFEKRSRIRELPCLVAVHVEKLREAVAHRAVVVDDVDGRFHRALIGC